MRLPTAQLLLAVTLGFFPGAAIAQTVTLDEGTFRILVGGREVGTESFSMRRSGSGPSSVIIARGTIVIDTTGTAEEIVASLQAAGATLRPSAYEVTIRGRDSERIAGRVVGGRFSARIRSPAGEQMREYLASDGAVLVDEGIVHHHYFIARRAADAPVRIPIIIPRLSRQVSAEVTARGHERVAVGGGTVEARHLVVTLAGAPERHLWVDSEGRVLRLEIPSSGFVAHRTTPPR
jgi:hypothetical protein